MAFSLTIKNFGKLADAEVSVGRFTVLAGPNNTGKSTVSKLLYSVFDGVNANHASIYLNNLINPLRRLMHRIFSSPVEKGNELISLNLLKEQLDEIENLAEVSPETGDDELDDLLQNIRESLDRLEESINKNKEELIECLPERKRFGGFWSKSRIKEAIDDVMRALINLKSQIKDLDAESVVHNGIGLKIRDNIVHNFQVQNFSSLRPNINEESVLTIGGAGAIRLKVRNEIEFDNSKGWLDLLQEYSRVIYLESPVYWKLKNALENLKLSPRFRFYAGQRLGGVPGYFYDLASLMREEYSGEMAFPELFEKLTSENVLDGKIEISEKGDLAFQQDEREFSLHLTAMGVINIGIIALLMEKKILDRGVFLFIDEPEAHLHPAWQVYVAEVLFNLARQGVNVVIATHSLNILKWLEVHIKDHPEDKELVALNQFSSGGVECGNNFEDMLSSVKEELSAPFAKLYIQGA